jgi:hypothetical protein
LGTF